MTKIFKVSDVRDILDKLGREEITYTRMVELLNEHAQQHTVSDGASEADYWSNRCKIVEAIWEKSNVEYIDAELADLEKEYYKFMKDNVIRHYR